MFAPCLYLLFCSVNWLGPWSSSIPLDTPRRAGSEGRSEAQFYRMSTTAISSADRGETVTPVEGANHVHGRRKLEASNSKPFPGTQDSETSISRVVESMSRMLLRAISRPRRPPILEESGQGGVRADRKTGGLQTACKLRWLVCK